MDIFLGWSLDITRRYSCSWGWGRFGHAEVIIIVQRLHSVYENLSGCQDAWATSPRFCCDPVRVNYPCQGVKVRHQTGMRIVE